ncbi:MAG: glycosyltransferase [Alphaproteobacteria bacterium]|nr:glycosyltransferase [Alphaproteobacteria bacterium]
MTTTFVSSSDHNYFPMLLEWVYSIRRFEQSKEMDICILNAGLKPEQVLKLEEQGCLVKKADWPCELPAHKIRGKEYLKSCVCRPYIPDYFPGYETYFWMDADTWVQKWNAVEMFLAGAQKGAITLTAQSDRAYPRQIRLKWLGYMPVKLRGFYFSNAKQAFGFKKAKELYPYHVLLAGAFALRGDAPHWKRWQELMLQALERGKVFTAEQLSLGVLCYLEGYKREVLPAYTHWLCEFKPLWNEDKKLFVEPSLPHAELGVLHISGWDDMRVNRSVFTDFETTGGKSIELSYRYPYFDGESA